MNADRNLSAELRSAVDELRATFGPKNVAVTPAASGVWVELANVDLGTRWSPATTWLGFHIASTYPYADIYPMFVDATCRLADGGLPPAVSENATIPARAERCLQISRRSNRWDPARDTAAAKAIKVIQWLRTP